MASGGYEYVGNMYHDNRDKLIVAAIDIGTTHSGYAFSFKNKYQPDPTEIYTNVGWVAGSMNRISSKTPTCVLFNPDKTFHSFGFEAENYYSELCLDDANRAWYFFRMFKMSLSLARINRDVEIEDDQGRKFPARKVFGEVIRYLKNNLLDYLKRRGNIVNNQVHWVLTMPAVWPDSGKQFMREAAYVAGIDDGQLSIVVEPAAAALYCQLLLNDKIQGAAQSDFTTAGSKFMVIDLGEDTADITVFEQQSDGNLTELRVPGGGPWGSSRVDQEFFQLIKNIVGEQVFKTFLQENDDDFVDLKRDFELKKRTVSPQSEGKIPIKIPVSIAEIYRDQSGAKVKEAVEKSQYKGRIAWSGDKLRIDSGLFKGLFKECANKIVQQVHEILNDQQVRGTNTFFMVGGFSESKIIKGVLKEAFPSGNMIVPDEPDLAVLRGAVLFGHKPVSITSRVERHTAGSYVSQSVGSDSYSASQTATHTDGSDFSHSLGSDSYSSSIRVSAPGIDRYCDMSRESEQERAIAKDGGRQSRNTVPLNPKEMMLDVYDSPRHGLQFVKEDDCKLFGHVVVKLPQKGEKRKVDVKMMMVTETEIDF